MPAPQKRPGGPIRWCANFPFHNKERNSNIYAISKHWLTMLVNISRYHKPQSIRFLSPFHCDFFRIRHRFLSSLSPRVIFSGIQPTGVPHIGNYLGALHEWVRIQNEAPGTCQLFFSIVDLHALTINQPATQLRKWKRQSLATLLAVGLDPKRSAIFYQSSVWLMRNHTVR